MPVDVKSALEKNVKDGVLTLASNMLPGLDVAFTQYIPGTKLVVTLNGDITGGSASAELKGTGNAAPFDAFTLDAKFTLVENDVDLDLTATVTESTPLSKMFPSSTVLSSFPMDKVALESGGLEFKVKNANGPTTISFGSVTSGIVFAYDGNGLGSVGIAFLVSYSTQDRALNFAVAGEITDLKFSDLWAPLAAIDFLEIDDLFLGISSSDVNLLNHDLKKGVTASAELSLGNNLAVLGKLLGSSAKLTLSAALESLSGPASLSADLKVNTKIDFGKKSYLLFNDFSLSWAFDTDNTTISASISGSLVIFGNGPTLTGSASITVGATNQSVTIGICGTWKNPFGFKRLTVNSCGFSGTFDETGAGLNLGGDITLGSHAAKPVEVSMSAQIKDFEIPDAFTFEVKGARDKGTPLTLTDLVDDITGQTLPNIPVIDEFAFKDLSLAIVATTYTVAGHTYHQGVTVSGDITFFSWELTFGFGFSDTKINAYGNLSKPIEISIDTTKILALEAASDADKGPSGSITIDDSGFALDLDAKLHVLGLVNDLALISWNDDKLSFDITLHTFFNLATANFKADIDPSLGQLDASLSVEAELGYIDIGPYMIGDLTIIPEIKIDIDFAVKLNAYISTTKKRLGFSFDLEIFGATLDIKIDINLTAAANALENFADWILQQLKHDAKAVFKSVLQSIEAFGSFLYHAGMAILDAVEAVLKVFGGVFIEVWETMTKIWTDAVGCAGNKADHDAGRGATLALAPGGQPDLAGALVDFARDESAQGGLTGYYVFQSEITRLVSRRGRIRDAARQALSEHFAGEETPWDPIAEATVAAMEEEASPELASAIRYLRNLPPGSIDRAGLDFDDYIDSL